MSDKQTEKKRGRKPKNSSAVKQNQTDPTQKQEKRLRKRGRRPLIPVRTFSEIQKQFENEKSELEFRQNDIPLTEEHVPTQVSWGNLNITIHEPPTPNTDDLIKTYNNQQLQNYEKEKEISKTFNKQIDNSSQSDSIQKNCKQTKNNCQQKNNCQKYPITKRLSVININKEKFTKVEQYFIHKQLEEINLHIEDKKSWPEKTNILCWWCCHSFDNVPIPSVSDYNKNMYKLKGIFCSWNCSLSYTLKNYKNSYNLYKLYKETTGKNLNIKKAPSKICLKAFGGFMTIKEFRQNNSKIKIASNNRMSYTNQEILEIKTQYEKY